MPPPKGANDNGAGQQLLEAKIGFGVSNTARQYSLGWRFRPAGKGGADFEFSVLGTRRESANDNDPEHGIGLRFTARW